MLVSWPLLFRLWMHGGVFFQRVRSQSCAGWSQVAHTHRPLFVPQEVLPPLPKPQPVPLWFETISHVRLGNINFSVVFTPTNATLCVGYYRSKTMRGCLKTSFWGDVALRFKIITFTIVSKVIIRCVIKYLWFTVMQAFSQRFSRSVKLLWADTNGISEPQTTLGWVAQRAR